FRTSPLLNPELVYVALLVPTLLPFSLHWYAGADPPLTGLVVNTTDAPAQTVSPIPEVIGTVGVREEIPDTVSAAWSVPVVTQVSLLVRIQLMISLLLKLLLV